MSNLGPTGYAVPPMCIPTPADRELERYTRWQDAHPDRSRGTCPNCHKTMERGLRRHVAVEEALIAGGWGLAR